jgi:transposase
VAVAEGGLRGEMREYGRIANTPAALRRLAGKLGQEGTQVQFCYEAGPYGYGIQHQLSTLGHECIVVAPSLIPKRTGDRVKTDRRDAASLARLHRAGELTAVWVPDPGHEGDARPRPSPEQALVRARLDAVRALRRARVNSFRASYCVRAATTGVRHGPSCIADGSRGSSSSRQFIISCSRITLPQSKPPRRGAIG